MIVRDVNIIKLLKDLGKLNRDKAWALASAFAESMPNDSQKVEMLSIIRTASSSMTSLELVFQDCLLNKHEKPVW